MQENDVLLQQEKNEENKAGNEVMSSGGEDGSEGHEMEIEMANEKG